jgi:hypothetical protein
MRKLAILVLIAATLSACNQERAARELPFPELVATGPFPELTESRRTKSDDGAGSQSAFERAISRAVRGDGDAEEAPTVALQTVSLAGRLVADVPLRFDEWRWSAAGHRTVIVHQLTGEAPDALILVEPFGPLMGRFPSQEMRRFQNGLDPSVAGSIDPLAMAVDQLAMNNPEAASQAMAMLGAYRALSSPTYGLGVGYQTTRKTFTGWRWIGKNDGGVTIRMARSQGTWGAQPPPGSDVIRAFDLMAQNTPEFEEFARYFRELREHLTREQARTPVRPASLIVGNATTDHKSGLHFAILCTNRCLVARELADFLTSIRLAGPGESVHLRPQPGDDPDQFARDMGLYFAHPDNVLSIGQVENMIYGLGR